ncbi:MAG: hypothetical protein ACYDCL_22290 [Myxococcales bacterium]
MTLSLAVALEPAAGGPFAQAVEAYRAGQLDRCEALLDGLSLQGHASALDEQARALVLRAAVAFARNHTATAREDLVQAHGRAAAALSAELFPPDFRDFDLTVQREEADRIAKLRELAAASKPAPPAPAGPPRVIVLKPLPPQDSPLWALVPLGVPQRRRGAVVWGNVLAAAQLAALATGLGSLSTAVAMQGPNGLYAPSQVAAARALNVAYLAGCYTALGLYLVGVADGLAFAPK